MGLNVPNYLVPLNEGNIVTQVGRYRQLGPSLGVQKKITSNNVLGPVNCTSPDASRLPRWCLYIAFWTSHFTVARCTYKSGQVKARRM
jgi:hypothetical protein